MIELVRKYFFGHSSFCGHIIPYPYTSGCGDNYCILLGILWVGSLGEGSAGQFLLGVCPAAAVEHGSEAPPGRVSHSRAGGCCWLGTGCAAGPPSRARVCDPCSSTSRGRFSGHSDFLPGSGLADSLPARVSVQEGQVGLRGISVLASEVPQQHFRCLLVINKSSRLTRCRGRGAAEKLWPRLTSAVTIHLVMCSKQKECV